VDPTRLQALNLTLASDPLSGMPLKGAGQNIPIFLSPAPGGLTVLNTLNAAVGVKVTVVGWRVRRGQTPLVENTDYKVVADDPTNAKRTFVFKTRTVHHTNDVSIPKDPTTIELDIKLEAGDPIPATNLPASALRTIELADLAVPRLGIPKILALFRHPSFAPTKDGVAGFVLILLPSNSPLGSFSGVKNFLDQLQDAVTNLAWAADFVGAATRIALLQTAITTVPNPKVKVGAQKNLHDITMINKVGGVDVHASDEISSLMFLADEGNRAYLFNDDSDWDQSEGYFWVEAGKATAMVIAVSHLAKRTPTSSPAGYLDVKNHSSDTNGYFNNTLSAVRFSAPQ
jgi:hypothetical protein